MGAAEPAPAQSFVARVTSIRGTVLLPPECDGSQLLAHALADLHRRGCPALLGDNGLITVQGRSEGRGSVLGVLDGDRIGPGQFGAARTLDYAFSTRGGLQLCAGLSVVAASLAWFSLESPGLTAFGLLAPLLWLYGANVVKTAIRVAAWLGQLCRSAPKLEPDAWR